MAVVFHENAHGRVAQRLGDPTAQQMGRLTLNPLAHIDPIGSLIVPIGMALVGLPPFGWARPVPINPSYFQKPYRGMMLVALAGPLTNLTLMGLSAVALRLLDLSYPDVAQLVNAGPHLIVPRVGFETQFLLGIFYFLFVFGLVNLILALFNLMPIPPLDGSRVLTYFLPEAGRRFMLSIERFALFIAIAIFLVLQWSHLLTRAFEPLTGWWLRLVLPV